MNLLAEQQNKAKKKSNGMATFEAKPYEFSHFDKKINLNKFRNDRRMRFRNSKDPIYIAFDFMDRQPLNKLAEEFVKDTVKDVMNFVSKITK